jgi:protoporphyrin/coproporphyrin ferrochelatase
LKTGIIINNIGTPDDCTPEAVGRYLKEFLMDKDIISAPWLIRYILVNWIIVPRRQFQSALKYKKIWGQNKSPLLEVTEKFCSMLQKNLGDQFRVEIGMRYGSNNVDQALVKFKNENIEKVIFVPMYPQYARATTGSAIDQFKLVAQNFPQIKYKIAAPFFRDSAFLSNQARILKDDIEKGQFEHIVFSFHGLPESQVLKNQGCCLSEKCCQDENQILSGCYRAQCFDTAHKIAQLANLPKQHYSISFQSRLGPTKWIKPYTTETVKNLHASGIQSLLVQTPSFVVDCIETLEEIAIELKSDFIEHGGSDLKLVPCLNDDEKWIQDFSNWILKQSAL